MQWSDYKQTDVVCVNIYRQGEHRSHTHPTKEQMTKTRCHTTLFEKKSSVQDQCFARTHLWHTGGGWGKIKNKSKQGSRCSEQQKGGGWVAACPHFTMLAVTKREQTWRHLRKKRGPIDRTHHRKHDWHLIEIKKRKKKEKRKRRKRWYLTRRPSVKQPKRWKMVLQRSRSPDSFRGHKSAGAHGIAFCSFPCEHYSHASTRLQ